MDKDSENTDEALSAPTPPSQADSQRQTDSQGGVCGGQDRLDLGSQSGEAI